LNLKHRLGQIWLLTAIRTVFHQYKHSRWNYWAMQHSIISMSIIIYTQFTVWVTGCSIRLYWSSSTNTEPIISVLCWHYAQWFKVRNMLKLCQKYWRVLSGRHFFANPATNCGQTVKKSNFSGPFLIRCWLIVQSTLIKLASSSY